MRFQIPTFLLASIVLPILTVAQEPTSWSTWGCANYTPISAYTQWGFSHLVSKGLYCNASLATGSHNSCKLPYGGIVEQGVMWNVSDAVNSNATKLVYGSVSVVDAIIAATNISNPGYATPPYGFFGDSAAYVSVNNSIEVAANSSTYVYFVNLMQCFVGSVSNCSASFTPDDTVLAVCSPIRSTAANGTLSNEWVGRIVYAHPDGGALDVMNMTYNPADVPPDLGTQSNNLNWTGLYGFGGWNNETDFPDGLVPKYGAPGVTDSAGVMWTGAIPTNGTPGVNETSGSPDASGVNGTNSTGGGKENAAVRGAEFTFASTLLVMGAVAALVL
ncbi:hypothetical protein MBLNU459_g0646t1 [Dothideomycetes sp. NU459]